MARRLLGLVVAVGLMAIGASAQADDSSSSPPPAAPVLRIVNGRRFYELPGEVVHGQRQQPWVFTLGGRSAVDYTAAGTSHSDASRVVDAVRHAPF